ESIFCLLRIGLTLVRTARLKIELRFSENARSEAEDSLSELQTRNVTLYSGGKYSDDAVVTVLEFLDLAVADEKVGPVMEAVARLTEAKLDRVPSATSVRRFAVASLSVAKAHAYEVLDQATDRGEQLCLYSDETNKLGSKLQLFGAGLVKENGVQVIILFGLAQAADKSAPTAFSLVKNRLDGLGRGVSDMLPRVISDWDSLSEAQHKQALTFYVFYCQLHAIANYTNIVLEALAEHERLATGRDVPALSPTVLVVLKEIDRRGCMAAPRIAFSSIDRA
ncbi:hypothetical protein PENTCL1PPCAC_24753, partial [Pristionchus entomophagus]